MHISLFYLPYNTIIFYGTVAAVTKDADTTEAVLEGVKNFRGQLEWRLSKTKIQSLFVMAKKKKPPYFNVHLYF